jgi:hypothetical protein
MYSIPKIYFCCAASDIPYGGVKVLYRHVDILNKYGFSAFIMHDKPMFRCTWFDNTTPIVYLGETRIYSTDYLVIPEEIFKKVNSEFRGIKKVVLIKAAIQPSHMGIPWINTMLLHPIMMRILLLHLLYQKTVENICLMFFPD